MKHTKTEFLLYAWESISFVRTTIPVFFSFRSTVKIFHFLHLGQYLPFFVKIHIFYGKSSFFCVEHHGFPPENNFSRWKIPKLSLKDASSYALCLYCSIKSLWALNSKQQYYNHNNKYNNNTQILFLLLHTKKYTLSKLHTHTHTQNPSLTFSQIRSIDRRCKKRNISN